MSSHVVRRALAHILAGLVLTLTACATDESEDPGPNVVRDSSGVRIVESAAPTWSPGEEWRVFSEMVVEIGTVDGPPETQLFSVTGTTVLPNGEIVVATGPELRWFDSAGHFLRSAGGAGDGPGELRFPTELTPRSDGSIELFDLGLQRVSRYGPDGSHQGDTRVQLASDALSHVFGFGPDGSVVYRSVQLPPLPPAPGTIVRDSSAIVVDSIPNVPDVGGMKIVLLPGAEWTVIQFRGEQTLAPMPPGISRYTLADPGPWTLFIGDMAEWEIRYYGYDGALRILARRPQSLTVLDDPTWERLRSRHLGQTSSVESRQFAEALWDGAPHPATLPAYHGLYADDDGGVWALNRISGGDTWQASVFDSTGIWLGDMPLPLEFELFEVGSDYVLGVHTDELDVERVRLYRLEKPARE